MHGRIVKNMNLQNKIKDIEQSKTSFEYSNIFPLYISYSDRKNASQHTSFMYTCTLELDDTKNIDFLPIPLWRQPHQDTW